MTDENFDPADELRRDIESAIEGQQPKEPEPDTVAETEPKPEAEAAEPELKTDAAGRKHDAKGRFVSTDGAETPVEPAEEPKEAKVEPPAAEPAKTEVRPPPGFSALSKAAWDYANPSPQEWEAIKADIVKREQEVGNGFKRYAGLGKFAEEAERNGTTLQNAVTDYVNVESALRQNPVQGVEFICQRMGIDPRWLIQVMAQRHFPEVRGQGQTEQTAPQQPAAPAIDANAIAQQVAQYVMTQAEQREQRREIDSQIAAFGADPKNKFFANVRPAMANLVAADSTLNLQTAYEAACWINPEIRQILLNETNGGRNKEAAAAATRSRAAAKAVGGSPSPGVNPDQTGKRQNLSIEDEIRAAIDAQVGAA